LSRDLQQLAVFDTEENLSTGFLHGISVHYLLWRQNMAANVFPPLFGAR
jgi:hypothetical protein